MSPSRSFIWTKCPAWIVATSLAGTGGSTNERTRPWYSTSSEATLAGEATDGLTTGVLANVTEVPLVRKVARDEMLSAEGMTPNVAAG